MILRCVFLFFIIGSTVLHAAQRGPSIQDLASMNISHPLIFSVSSGQMVNNLLSDVEIGLGGAKIGVGLGAMEQQSLLAIKGVVMYKWEAPFGAKQFDLDDILDEQVDFPDHRFYYGAEAVLSSQMYRIALGAYRIYDPEEDDVDDTYYGASVGVGF